MGLYVRDAVLGPFAAWNQQFEDYKRFLYADIKGLVTTGIGNLADPIGLALAMPWKIDGRTASQAEIATAWNAVKSAFNAASTPPKADWYAHLTNIRLDDGYIRTLVTQTLKANDAMLARRTRATQTGPLMRSSRFIRWRTQWAWGAFFPAVCSRTSSRR